MLFFPEKCTIKFVCTLWSENTARSFLKFPLQLWMWLICHEKEYTGHCLMWWMCSKRNYAHTTSIDTYSDEMWYRTQQKDTKIILNCK